MIFLHVFFNLNFTLIFAWKGIKSYIKDDAVTIDETMLQKTLHKFAKFVATQSQPNKLLDMPLIVSFANDLAFYELVFYFKEQKFLPISPKKTVIHQAITSHFKIMHGNLNELLIKHILSLYSAFDEVNIFVYRSIMLQTRKSLINLPLSFGLKGEKRKFVNFLEKQKRSLALVKDLDDMISVFKRNKMYSDAASEWVSIFLSASNEVDAADSFRRAELLFQPVISMGHTPNEADQLWLPSYLQSMVRLKNLQLINVSPLPSFQERERQSIKTLIFYGQYLKVFSECFNWSSMLIKYLPVPVGPVECLISV